MAGREFARFSDLPREIRLIIWELAVPNESRIVEIRQRRLRKTVKDWEEQHDTIWHAGHGLSEEDYIGRQITKITEVEATGVTDTDDLNSDDDADSDSDVGEAPGLTKRKKSIVDSHMAYRELNCLVGIESECSPPGILFASRESYMVASNYYTKAFSCLGSIAQTWFNFDKDTLFIHAAEFIADLYEHSPFEIVNHLLGIFPILDFENVRRVKDLAIQFDEYNSEGDLQQTDPQQILASLMQVFRGVRRLTVIVPHFTDNNRDPDSLYMTDPMPWYHAVDLYKEYVRDLHSYSDSEEESSESDDEDEIIDDVKNYAHDRWFEQPLLKDSDICHDIIDAWWKILMPGLGPRPNPDIQFQGMM